MSKPRVLTDYRRAYLRLAIVEIRRRLKVKAIAYKGGKCEICGYSKCPAAFDFHHVDPSVKDFGISGNTRSFEKLRPELDKTMLLCANCHRELHDEKHVAAIELRRVEMKEKAPPRGRPR